MRVTFPIEIDVKAKARSAYTREDAERRLAELEGREGAEAGREREYLRALLARKEGLCP
jgi:hypothetical protein